MSGGTSGHQLSRLPYSILLYFSLHNYDLQPLRNPSYYHSYSTGHYGVLHTPGAVLLRLNSAGLTYRAIRSIGLYRTLSSTVTCFLMMHDGQ